MKLKDNAFGLGDDNSIDTWYEFLIPETARPLAYADHQFFGQWPAVTENSYGKGKLYYIGTYPSQTLMNKVVRLAALDKNLIAEDEYEFPIIMRSGVNGKNCELTYIFNYSDRPVTVTYRKQDSVNILTDRKIRTGDNLTIGPWDLAIMKKL